MSAAQHEVTTAYERAKATYTQGNPAIYTIFSEQEARELLAMIEEAYSVLGNKTLRSVYDQRLLGGQYKNSDLTYEAIQTASKQFLPDTKNENKKHVYSKDASFEKEIIQNKKWTGDFLKKVREYKKISLDSMFEITKINPYYIQAIESMACNDLPALVFVRGYVLQMAKALHLPEKEVADSYMTLFKNQNTATVAK
ncbi:MAG: helix-turn-helix domain-containing protein [Pseudobdellovibrionaceae bacterium]